MKGVLIIILSLISVSLSAQIFFSDTLETIAYWKQGESYQYQMDKYKLKQKNDTTTETNTTSFINLFIQEETDTSYLIKYSIDSLKVNGPLENDPMVNALTSEVTKKLSYLIETDQNGTFIEIKNWEELRTNIVDLISETRLFDEMEKEQKERSAFVLKNLTDSKEKIQSMFSKEFFVLFSNYGYSFYTKDTVEYEQSLPNPFGGDPFPQTGKIFFDSSAKDSTNSIILYDFSSIDEEMGKKALIQILKQISPDTESIDTELQNVEFKISDSTSQEYNLENGSILKAVKERKVISNDLKERNVAIERQTWKLLNVELKKE